MEVQISVQKTNKYASSESGDTVEVIERPGGGISIVVADGQSSGRGAKRISNMVTRKIVSLLAEGVRDGAAARAASDYLFAERHGKVSATLNIISIDHQTNSLVITRNNPTPVYAVSQDGVLCLAEESKPVGLYRNTRPVITELPLEAGLMVIVYTDGLVHAGSRSGKSLDIQAHITHLVSSGVITPESVCGSLLSKAVELDENRPVDDTSIAVVGVLATQGQDKIRRMDIRLPID